MEISSVYIGEISTGGNEMVFHTKIASYCEFRDLKKNVSKILVP